MTSSSSNELRTLRNVLQENPCVGAVFSSVRLSNELGVIAVDLPLLPAAAAEAVVLGLESTTLFELAAASMDDPPLDLLDLYLRFCDDVEWHISPKTRTAQWLNLARSWAQFWQCGSLTASAVSDRIWRIISRHVPESDLDPYLPFIALASDWEDFPDARGSLERQMVEHLRELADEWEVV